MISYAQNFEDVMLARLFAGQRQGFYVDVGASHPTQLSVTKYFYDLGWRGINVEPIRAKWQLFVDTRLRDINLNVAAGSTPGRQRFYYVPDNDALSTSSPEQAAALAAQGYSIVESTCDVRRLDAILAVHAEAAIEFMKIDAEGSEGDILRSIDLQAYRPKVLLIEVESHPTAFPGWDNVDIEQRLRPPAWEGSVLSAGYLFAHFDGLNRFYLRQDVAHLKSRLAVPPGVFDFVVHDAIAAAETASAEKERVIQDLASRLADQSKAEIQELAPIPQVRQLAGDLVPFARPIGRAVRRTRLILRPRLGVLRQYAPRPLEMPAHTFAPVDARPAPSIAIVTPSLQQGDFIEHTLRSILGQGYPKLEYRVQDGGSTDKTVAILQQYAPQLTDWQSQPDGGQANAINVGFKRTVGEIMGWVNSDDVLLPGALWAVAQAFLDHPDVEVVYGNRLLIDANGMEIGRWLLPGHDDKALLWADYVPQETLFWRRSVWQRVGAGLDESFKFAMDWDLLVRFRDAGARFAHIPRFLGAFRVHDQQKTSSQVHALGQEEMQRIRQRTLGRVPSRSDINAALKPFIVRHVVADVNYRVRRYLSPRQIILQAAAPLAEAAWGFRHKLRRMMPFLAPRITRLRQHAPRALRCPAHRSVDAAASPRIDVVTPSYAQGAFLERTIKSVLEQNYPNLAYVVMDGGSTDASLDVLQRYDKRLVRWVSAPDRGQADAINKGFAGTSGDIMGYVNSDDLLLPGSLAVVASYMATRPHVDVVYGHRILIDENDDEIGRWILPRHDPFVLRWVDWIPQETLFWRRRAWERVGGAMDVSFKFALDWDLLLRFQQEGLRIERIDRFLGAFRVHALQKTNVDMPFQGLGEMRRLRQRSFGRDVSDTEIRNAVWRYLLKHVGADLTWRLGLKDLES
jgi:FkbM family methyltransferase